MKNYRHIAKASEYLPIDPSCFSKAKRGWKAFLARREAQGKGVSTYVSGSKRRILK